MTIIIGGDTPRKVMAAYWNGDLTKDEAIGYIGATLFEALNAEADE